MASVNALTPALSFCGENEIRNAENACFAGILIQRKAADGSLVSASQALPEATKIPFADRARTMMAP